MPYTDECTPFIGECTSLALRCKALSTCVLHVGTIKKVAAYENAKLASAFDPQNRAENIDYYVAKLDELVKKFSGIGAEASGAKQESLVS